MTDNDATIDTDDAALFADAAGVPDDGRVASSAVAGPSLCLGGQVFPLKPGENLVGRGEEADVRLASASVSRRHARIRIESTAALLEDLQSRNGTVARDERVAAPTRLNDGDAVRFGVVWLVYRTSTRESGTR